MSGSYLPWSEFFLTTNLKRFKWLFWILILLTFLVMGCSDSKYEVKKNQAKLEKEMTERQISQFASKYNALLDWGNALLDLDNDFRYFYTTDLQKAVMETSGKPLVLRLYVNDIYMEDGKFIVQFFHDNYLDTEIYYNLECNEELVNKIKGLQKNRSKWGRGEVLFAIIAQLKNVQKIKFVIEPSGEEVSVETGDLYSISGQCIDLIKI